MPTYQFKARLRVQSSMDPDRVQRLLVGAIEDAPDHAGIEHLHVHNATVAPATPVSYFIRHAWADVVEVLLLNWADYTEERLQRKQARRTAARRI